MSDLKCKQKKEHKLQISQINKTSGFEEGLFRYMKKKPKQCQCAQLIKVRFTFLTLFLYWAK